MHWVQLTTPLLSTQIWTNKYHLVQKSQYRVGTNPTTQLYSAAIPHKKMTLSELKTETQVQMVTMIFSLLKTLINKIVYAIYNGICYANVYTIVLHMPMVYAST